MDETDSRPETSGDSAGTSDRLAGAALAILTEEGADAVTMRRVAAAAGVTAMATYRHYPNRAAVLRAVADAANAELAATLVVHAESADFASRFTELIDAFLSFALGKPHLFSFLITERREGARRFPDDFGEFAPPSFAPLVAAVQQGMRDGDLREDDALEVAMAINSEAVGLMQQYLAGRIGCSEDEFRALCKRSMRRMLNGLEA